MHFDWQTSVAVAIVLITLAVFAVRVFRSKKKTGCSHNCGCGKK